MSTRTRIATIAGACTALTAIAGSASAVQINYTALPNNGNIANIVQPPVNITVTSPIRNFKYKTVNGVTGVGVSGGAVDGEIDNDESINFAFSEAVNLNMIKVCFLYTDGNFGDVIDEVAKFVTNVGTYTLTATTATSGTWTGPAGTVTNVSIATEAGGASWRIEAPGTGLFGAAVTSLSLQSGWPSTYAKKADFAFQCLDYSRNVPTPGAVALLGTAGLVTISHRRRKA